MVLRFLVSVKSTSNSYRFGYESRSNGDSPLDRRYFFFSSVDFCHVVQGALYGISALVHAPHVGGAAQVVLHITEG